MPVERAHNGAVELAYETFGPPDGEPLLLIMGMGSQMVWWPDGFCEALAARGFAVARFDNRDSGLSTHFAPQQRRNLFAVLFQGSRDPSYTSVDMAQDAVCAMDAVGWGSAHVLGASMGGMLAQLVASRHPDRVRTLTALSSRPGRSAWTLVRHMNVRTVLRLMRAGRRSRGDEVGDAVEVMRIISSTGRPFDEQRARAIAEQARNRRPADPNAVQRHADIGWPGDRLRDIRVPTLVLHGEQDPVLRGSAGRSIAKGIPGAELVTYPGMGHSILNRELWSEISAEVEDFAGRHPKPGTHRTTNRRPTHRRDR